MKKRAKFKPIVYSPRLEGAPDWSYREHRWIEFMAWLYATGRLNDG